MNVILLDKMPHLGDLGDQVKVKPGHGRNYLIPQGKAVPATPDNIAYFEARRAELQKAAAERLASAQKRAEALEALSLTIEMNASDEGKLFGSVGPVEIVRAIEAAGAEASKQEIQLPASGPIRAIGDYEVKLHLNHGDVIATVKLSVVAEK